MNINDFDIASNHPFECKCKLCIEWWDEVGPEPDDMCSCIGEDDPDCIIHGNSVIDE